MGKKEIVFILLSIGLICVKCIKTVNPEVPGSVTLYQPQIRYATAVKMVWSKAPSENFNAYNLYYSTAPGVSDSSTFGTTIIYKNDTTFLLTGLEENTTYYAKVYTYNSTSYSESNEISFTTEQCKCGTFTNERDHGMVLLPAGCFIGKDLAKAAISKDFFMDTTEVTESEWNTVMGAAVFDTMEFSKEDWNIILSIDTVTSKMPKVYVSWYQIILFCNEKSKQQGRDTCYTFSLVNIDSIGMRIDGLVDLQCDFSRNAYRLPTEDEWEYAYHGGGTTEYFWGKDGNTSVEYPFEATYPTTTEDSMEISEYAWWSNNNDPNGPKEVAQKKPNAWYLYDMAGNIEEFVWDIYSQKRDMSRIDFRGPEMGPQSSDLHMLRGGFYNDISKKPTNLTAWWRYSSYFPEMDDDAIGFRTVATALP